MTRNAIRIPEVLDEPAIMAVLKRLNLLETGAREFGHKEISASLKWARIPQGERERFLDAVGSHGLFREPDAVPARIPWRMPLLKNRK